ncbi:CIPK3 [Blepharisma stoltei]|uniref:non-specific serine/threonine protein kinase n=1 Tax=Blepharisma stoltei TaxID=1481888 RepID=A0AAU9JMC3_9CILI|nr:unnamed protein product [Blepharisma stoltei]
MMKRVGNYELGSVLGEGSYGKVRMGVHIESGEKFAIKILDKARIKQENLIENLRQEIHIMKHIRHPNIVKLYEVLSSHSKIYLVLELVTGGELFDKIKECGPLPETQVRNYFQQIISAVAFCECQHIAHRDLKLENVLLDKDGVLKISDFGLSGLFKFDKFNIELMYSTCGTLNYLAPETFGNQGYDGHLSDIWSCGVILYAMLAGTLPFEDDSISRLIEKILSCNYEMPKNISISAQDLLRQILNPDPRTRISISKIKKHPWFLENYREPEGLYNEAENTKDSSQMMIDNQEDRPRVMNAFEIINYCTGTSINKLFDNEEFEPTHILSDKDPLLIIEKINDVMTTLKVKKRIQESTFKILYESMLPPNIQIEVEILEILPSLHVAIFERHLGNLMLYRKIFTTVKTALNQQ